MFGAFVSDWLGPRYTLVLGVTLQSVVGFIMAGAYAKLSQPSLVGAFTVVYGSKWFSYIYFFFLSFFLSWFYSI